MSRELTAFALVAMALAAPPPARAGGFFAGAEVGLHRITPLDPVLGKVVDGDRSRFTVAAQVGCELGPVFFVAAEARRLTFSQRFNYAGDRFLGPLASTVRLTPLMAVIGVKPRVSARVRFEVSGGAGGAIETIDTLVRPEVWSGRHQWRAVGRVGAGVEYAPSALRMGLRADWVFLPAILIPTSTQADFGGLTLGATLSFGRAH